MHLVNVIYVEKLYNEKIDKTKVILVGPLGKKCYYYGKCGFQHEYNK